MHEENERNFSVFCRKRFCKVMKDRGYSPSFYLMQVVMEIPSIYH